jgi:hypothetical protein
MYTNGFEYKEQITAAYVNLMKEYKKFSFQAGMRGENTIVKAGSIKKDVMYTRDYFNLFPMVSVNYNPSQKHSFQLSYNRRINRPSYSSFNPYKYFVNLFVSVQGNPYLLPEYHQSIEFTHGLHSSFYNTLGFSVINNFFYGYPFQNDSTKETLQKTGTLAEAYDYSYSMYLQHEIKKWWNVSFNGIATYLQFAGKIEEKDYSGNALQFRFFINNQLSLPKSLKLEVAARYFAPTNVVIYQKGPMFALDLGIRRNFFKNKMSITVGMNDIFYTWVVTDKVQYDNINSRFRATYDTQRFKANITYNFGKVKVQQRQTKSNQEEKGRLEH